MAKNKAPLCSLRLRLAAARGIAAIEVSAFLHRARSAAMSSSTARAREVTIVVGMSGFGPPLLGIFHYRKVKSRNPVQGLEQAAIPMPSPTIRRWGKWRGEPVAL